MLPVIHLHEDRLLHPQPKGSPRSGDRDPFNMHNKFIAEHFLPAIQLRTMHIRTNT